MNRSVIYIVLSVFILGIGDVYGLDAGNNLKEKNVSASKILPVSVALGVVICVGGVCVYNKVNNNDLGYDLKYEKFSYESKESVNKIEIDGGFGNIDISSEDISRPIINYCQNEKIKYRISEGNGILKIKEVVKFSLNFNCDNDKSPGTLKIIVPKKKIDFNISGSAGNLSLEDLESSYIKINHSFGNIDLENITSDKIDIHAFAGNIYVKNLNSENIKIKNSTGNVFGSLVGQEEDYIIYAHNTLGNCNLENTSSGSRSLCISNSIGNINISFYNKKPTAVS